jgi:hypothetical protein
LPGVLATLFLSFDYFIEFGEVIDITFYVFWISGRWFGFDVVKRSFLLIPGETTLLRVFSRSQLVLPFPGRVLTSCAGLFNALAL